MKRHPFANFITVLVVCWIGIVVAAAFFNPEEAQRMWHEAVSGADKANPDGQPGSLLDEIDLPGLFSHSENTPAKWFLFVSAVFIAMLVARILVAVLSRVGRRLESQGWNARAHLANDLIGPASLAIFTFGLAIGLAGIKKSEPLQTFCSKTLLLMYSIAAFWYAYNLIAVVDVGLRRFTARTESKLDEQLVPLIRKTLRVVLIVIGAMFIIESVFQQDIGAWLAGLGIAGLAVSLAAQDSLKNLFGSITILLDRPFKVGERIIYGGYDGVIEEIGFRSTKVRTFTGHLVTVPNSTIVNTAVENVARRPYIRRIMDVTITYDTPRAKIEEAVNILRNILEEEDLAGPIHQTIDGNDYPPRVYFNDYKADSLNLFVIYWYAPPAWWDYMDHAQRLNLRIFEEF
ncbi:MAG: mechanosensitive ion channel family protein, partial [Pirellulales bacterium]|nr:mechanosensitive ion channel family protein [Pirellulales bacterium]